MIRRKYACKPTTAWHAGNAVLGGGVGGGCVGGGAWRGWEFIILFLKMSHNITVQSVARLRTPAQTNNLTWSQNGADKATRLNTTPVIRTLPTAKQLCGERGRGLGVCHRMSRGPKDYFEVENSLYYFYICLLCVWFLVFFCVCVCVCVCSQVVSNALGKIMCDCNVMWYSTQVGWKAAWLRIN